MTVFDDLEAEQDRLERILLGLPADAWLSPSGAPGWSVTDVVLHLAQCEEAVVATAAGHGELLERGGGSLDDAMDLLVRGERGAPETVFERWRVARRAAMSALRRAERADPRQLLRWAAAPLKPGTLATTRLAEHWAHGLDITGPLGIPFPDTDRLRHIAWLGYSTLPYAFRFAGQEPHDVYCELSAPDGAVWRYGSAGVDSTISGSAGAFCRVGARRLSPERSGLVASGPQAAAALAVLRNYAG